MIIIIITAPGPQVGVEPLAQRGPPTASQALDIVDIFIVGDISTSPSLDICQSSRRELWAAGAPGGFRRGTSWVALLG